jgi:hypothetical protein
MGYAPMFVVAGVLGPLGLVVTVLLAGRITPIPRSQLKDTPTRDLRLQT